MDDGLKDVIIAGVILFGGYVLALLFIAWADRRERDRTNVGIVDGIIKADKIASGTITGSAIQNVPSIFFKGDDMNIPQLKQDTMGHPLWTPEQRLRVECLEQACLAASGMQVSIAAESIITKARRFEVYIMEGS